MNNIGMVKVLKNECFLDGLFLFFLRHVLNVHFFYDQHFLCGNFLDEIGFTECTLPKEFFLSVNLIFIFNYFDIHSWLNGCAI